MIALEDAFDDGNEVLVSTVGEEVIITTGAGIFLKFGEKVITNAGKEILWSLSKFKSDAKWAKQLQVRG